MFGTGNTYPDHERVHVDLRDSAKEPVIARTRALLHLMVATGTV